MMTGLMKTLKIKNTMTNYLSRRISATMADKFDESL